MKYAPAVCLRRGLALKVRQPCITLACSPALLLSCLLALPSLSYSDCIAGPLFTNGRRVCIDAAAPCSGKAKPRHQEAKTKKGTSLWIVGPPTPLLWMAEWGLRKVHAVSEYTLSESGCIESVRRASTVT